MRTSTSQSNNTQHQPNHLASFTIPKAGEIRSWYYNPLPPQLQILRQKSLSLEDVYFILVSSPSPGREAQFAHAVFVYYVRGKLSTSRRGVKDVGEKLDKLEKGLTGWKNYPIFLYILQQIRQDIIDTPSLFTTSPSRPTIPSATSSTPVVIPYDNQVPVTRIRERSKGGEQLPVYERYDPLVPNSNNQDGQQPPPPDFRDLFHED